MSDRLSHLDKLRNRFPAWLRAPNVLVLMVTLVMVLGFLGFAAIALEVREGEHQGIEESVISRLRDPAAPADPRGPEWLIETVRDLSALGGAGVIIFVCLSASGYFALKHRYGALCFLSLATLGGWGLNTALKHFFMRQRPDVVTHLTHVDSWSFPSGHAMVSAIVYLTLGALLAQQTNQMRGKLFILAIAVVMTILVGLSRIYLGVHYPSDVVAGWIAGLAWMCLCWVAARLLSPQAKPSGSGRRQSP